MKNTTQGFTLIELLIVIAIIGILAAVLIPNLLGARQRAYDTSAMSCARAIGLAAEDVKINNAADATYNGLDGAAVVAFDPKSCEAIASSAGAALTGATFEVKLNTAKDDFLGSVKHPKGKTTYYMTKAGIQAGGTAPTGF